LLLVCQESRVCRDSIPGKGTNFCFDDYCFLGCDAVYSGTEILKEDAASILGLILRFVADSGERPTFCVERDAVLNIFSLRQHILLRNQFLF
jgi:hypothetical protein